VETLFADELASGKVTFQSINVQDEANADIVEKYNNASYLTLCINTVRDGTDHIEEVTDIWLVIGYPSPVGTASGIGNCHQSLSDGYQHCCPGIR
jgi:hypothetical protein